MSSLANVTAAGGSSSLDLAPAEVKQLWWFLDGSIMDAAIRGHLRKGWGFCARHTWAHAVTEIELRGGTPFSTAILYEDLTRRAALAVAPRFGRPGARRLEPSASCLACEYLEGVRTELSGPVGRHWDEQAEIVNQRRRTVKLLLATELEWRSAGCPHCLGGHGPICRPHLLIAAELPESLAAALEELAGRLRTLIDSLTARRSSAGPRDAASWIEALAWFAGWQYPARLAEERPA